MRRISKWPSPGAALAFTALLVTLGGTAVALPGRDRVTSGDIRNNTLRTVDYRDGSVASHDIRDDSIAGSDVNESTLGKVPNAANADTAGTAIDAVNASNATNARNAAHAASASSLNGNTLRSFSGQVKAGQSGEVVDFKGVQLVLHCLTPTTLDIDMNNTAVPPSPGHVAIQSGSNTGVHATASHFTSGHDLVAPNSGSGAGTANVVFGGGGGPFISVTFGFFHDGFTTDDTCHVWGHMIVAL